MDYFDRDELKTHLRDYLESQGINTNRLFKCLNPSHNDSTPSMKYFEDEKVYCFGCGATYDLIDTIAVCENCDRGEAYKRAYNYYGRSNNRNIVNKSNQQIKSTTQTNGIDKNYEKAFSYWERQLIKTKEALDYLKSRGIDEKTCKKFHLGYNLFNFKNNDFKSIIIPINAHCFTARNIDPNSDFRYYKTKGEHSDLFNKQAISNSDKYCVITEGEFDALSYESLGINATALGSVSNFQKFKDSKKDKNKVFILSLDNDKAGDATLDKFQEYFKENKIRYKVFDNLGYKDANLALINERDILERRIKKIVKDIENQDEMN